MRRPLFWSLGVALALSAWALLSPAIRSEVIESKSNVDASTQVSHRQSAPASMVNQKLPLRAQPTQSFENTAFKTAEPMNVSDAGLVSVKDLVSSDVLPAQWPFPSIEPANRSPFLFSTPTVQSPPKSVVKVANLPTLPQPVPLSLSYRYWGEMTTPEGLRLVYVVRADNGAPVQIQVGSRLDDGFVVEEIESGRIVFVQQASHQQFILVIPSHESDRLR
jgi:hypothetical protein